jgi:hypothetical protein
LSQTMGKQKKAGKYTKSYLNEGNGSTYLFIASMPIDRLCMIHMKGPFFGDHVGSSFKSIPTELRFLLLGTGKIAIGCVITCISERNCHDVSVL